ncbi:hypothetical protein OAP56_01630 [Rickettsiaceae bacterium]|nr:hypothetical protein [Rickettsiaceae bacterium]
MTQVEHGSGTEGSTLSLSHFSSDSECSKNISLSQGAEMIRDQFVMLADEIVEVLMEAKSGSLKENALHSEDSVDKLADKFDQLLARQFYEITAKMKLVFRE